MGREVRRVPKNWVHPKQYDGGRGMRYVPMFEGGYEEALAEWDAYREKHGTEATVWDMGAPPTRDRYMPNWPEQEKTHYMMYETCTEGTPISPPMESPKALARWLADNGASSFGNDTATYEQWLSMIGVGWAPTAVIQGGEIRSGVSMASDPKEER